MSEYKVLMEQQQKILFIPSPKCSNWLRGYICSMKSRTQFAYLREKQTPSLWYTARFWKKHVLFLDPDTWDIS